MACFDVTLTPTTARPNGSTERVDGADAYQQEGPLTTFFAVDGDRLVIDSWSTRLASFRTAEIVAIRRVEATADLDVARSTGALTLVQTA